MNETEGLEIVRCVQRLQATSIYKPANIANDVQRALDKRASGITLIGEIVFANVLRGSKGEMFRFQNGAVKILKGGDLFALVGDTLREPASFKTVTRRDGSPIAFNETQLRNFLTKKWSTAVKVDVAPGYLDNTWRDARFRCSAGHEWDAKPERVLNGSWCPICTKHSVKTLRGKMSGYVYVAEYDEGRYTKIGSTSNIDQRIRQLRGAKRLNGCVELVALYDAGTGANALRIEKAVHERLRAFNAGLSGFIGATELYHVSPDAAGRLIRKEGGIKVSLR